MKRAFAAVLACLVTFVGLAEEEKPLKVYGNLRLHRAKRPARQGKGYQQ